MAGLELNADLLDHSKGLVTNPGDLNASLNAHGLYNSFQFVLRLSPEVHRRLAALPKGIVTGPINFEGLQAFSTYLHETIHWWQHVGSTIGLLRSLSYPAQAHANYSHLRRLLASVGPKKSVRRLIETLTGEGGPGTTRGLANTIVNNHYDIEFFRIFITEPNLIPEIIKTRLFDCVGHSYEITYLNILAILATSVDRDFSILPDPRGWEGEFAKLRAQKKEGYYPGSNVRIAPLGAYEIFEGQARFAQLQYLYFGTGRRLTWSDIRSAGKLDGVYGRAFETFLHLAELAWPTSVDDPIVALFLLVCDVAINPGAGFPMPLLFFPSFIEDVDPGVRFLFLCRTIAKDCPNVAGAIRSYSRTEYLDVSEELTRPLIIDSPFAIAETVNHWMDSEGLKPLMTQYSSFDFAPENLPISVLFSHFLAFNKDKFHKPEVFCWPGAWMAGERVSSEVVKLFYRHAALFVDKAEDDGVFPQIVDDRSEETVHRTFQTFYDFNVTYDMTRQWIAMPGPFIYDYRWLSSSASHTEFKSFADRNFERTYGVQPDKFELV